MDESPVAVNEPVVADTTPTESAPVQSESSEVTVDEFDGLGDVSLSEPTKPESTEKEAPEAEEDIAEVKETTESETETQPRGKAEERKQQLNNEIRDLVSTRNALKAQVEQANAEVYQPATDTELLGQINPETGEYYNPLEAKFENFKQVQELEKYNSQVAESQLTISHEAQRAVTDFPMFDANSDKYNPEIASKVDDILRANLIIDDNTQQITGSRVSPYQLYKSFDDVFKAASSKGQANAQRATAKMLANVDTTSNAPSRGSSDPLDALFDRVKDAKFA